MTAAILFVAVMLTLGVALRVKFRLFSWLFIPASVLAGFLGLLLVQLGQWAVDDTVLDPLSPLSESKKKGVPDLSGSIDSTLTAIVETLSGWPSFLIAVVFAGMLLERKPTPFRQGIGQVGRQGLMVWIIVLGQTAVGLMATWLLIQPNYDVPNSVGMLIETGFAGGHGTAAAMGKVFSSETIGFQSGLDLGILMATCGLVYGVVTGIGWVNLGIRRGWVAAASESDATTGQSADRSEPPIGYAKVGNEIIDPLLLQAVWLALAVAAGMAMQWAVAQFALSIDSWRAAAEAAPGAGDVLATRMSASRVLDFPLFIYTLFGGLLVRQCLRLFGQERAVDRETINRLTGAAMDVLVVAAMTSLNLAAVASLLVPFSILFVCGALWAGLCLLLISRWVLPPGYWFQLGLINYGMSTGTTATGFVLLRVVDPELDSGAAEDYALAAPLSSPFIGGGMITVALPLLLLERVPIAYPAFGLTILVAVLVWIGWRWNRPARRGGPVELNDTALP